MGVFIQKTVKVQFQWKPIGEFFSGFKYNFQSQNQLCGFLHWTSVPGRNVLNKNLLKKRYSNNHPQNRCLVNMSGPVVTQQQTVRSWSLKMAGKCFHHFSSCSGKPGPVFAWTQVNNTKSCCRGCRTVCLGLCVFVCCAVSSEITVISLKLRVFILKDWVHAYVCETQALSCTWINAPSYWMKWSHRCILLPHAEMITALNLVKGLKRTYLITWLNTTCQIIQGEVIQSTWRAWI